MNSANEIHSFIKAQQERGKQIAEDIKSTATDGGITASKAESLIDALVKFLADTDLAYEAIEGAFDRLSDTQEEMLSDMTNIVHNFGMDMLNLVMARAKELGAKPNVMLAEAQKRHYPS